MKAATVNRTFRAFSDPIRLRFLHLLVGGESCVGDLVAALQVPQPTASRHLRTLRDAGLVTVRRDGRWSFYALASPTSDFERALHACVSGCFGAVPELRKDAARLRALKRSGGCCGAPRGDAR
jgi:ArsR family transcriptional regulator